MGFFSEIPVWIQEHVKISNGGHEGDPLSGACIMEFVSLIDPREERMTDQPSCVVDPLKELAISINDSVSDEYRNRLKTYAHRFIDTVLMTREEEAEMIEAAKEWFNKNKEGTNRSMHDSTALGPVLESCNDLLYDIENQKSTEARGEASLSLIHALLPYDRHELTPENLDWRGAWALFSKRERVSLFGEEAADLPAHVAG